MAPEAGGPAFSNTPAALPQVEAITSQVEVVTPIGGAEQWEATPVETLPEIAPEAVFLETPLEETFSAEGELAETPVPIDVVPAAEAPTVDIVRPSDVVPSAIPTAEALAADFGGVFVDPTDYAVGSTPAVEGDEAGPEVFISERSTGCEYTVDSNSLGHACGPIAQNESEEDAPKSLIPGVNRAGGSINIGPVSISRSGIRFTGSVATVASREYYNTVAKPLVDLQAGESFVFPLASASPITSLFGWRWHPIHNDYRFHGGTDLGAPMGTPILATKSGQVAIADNLGGYGLTVVLRHSENTLESRYAHMSHILVQPGEWVEQGDVIGLVGSTGNSTGPHLHFELHQLTGQGWVAVSPNEVLSYALANLNERSSGNPLAALNIIPKAQATPAKAALPKAVKTETLVKDAPNFRPAQPNAQ
ncbi:M23 family metallopeptidase [Leptothoe kymatousa TAU-MAC 1615]|uniref:M23 family metallopeptidase n=2 Tax=Leptothoe TaxID=2651725 RepID=A0ABS5Y280_9CYAN|nr:M23 family metallopeptidase [Leptothoe kymatousa TAU-MAC 1615]